MSDSPNLYDILGLEKEASLEDIKKAYRTLAQRYHPDKAGDDPIAAQRFADVVMAYEILSDEDKRAQYDRPQRKRVFYRQTWRPPGGNNFSATQSNVRKPHRKAWKKKENNLNLDDLFSQTGGRPKQHSTPRQNARRSGSPVNGADIHLDVSVEELIAKRGGTTTIEYRRNRRGDGLDVFPMDEIFHLRVPPQTRHGQVLTVDKMGHSGSNGGISGNLHCRVKIVPSTAPRQSATHHSEVSVDIEIPITFAEAVFGTRIRIHTPTGKLLVSVPARSSSGRKLRLRGRGEGGADFVASLRIVLPEQLDEESLRLVQQFAERNPLSPREDN